MIPALFITFIVLYVYIVVRSRKEIFLLYSLVSAQLRVVRWYENHPDLPLNHPDLLRLVKEEIAHTEQLRHFQFFGRKRLQDRIDFLKEENFPQAAS